VKSSELGVSRPGHFLDVGGRCSLIRIGRCSRSTQRASRIVSHRTGPHVGLRISSPFLSLSFHSESLETSTIRQKTLS
jgi:hypothetical protein